MERSFFLQEMSTFPQQTKKKKKEQSKIYFFFYLASYNHGKKTKLQVQMLSSIGSPSVPFTRVAVSRELFESLGAKPESIPHAQQTAGLKLLSGLSLYD